MAGIDPAAVRDALAGLLKANLSREFNTYDGYVPLSPTPPAILLMAPDGDDYIEYAPTYGRPGGTINIDIWVLIAPGPNGEGQRIIDECLSAGVGHQNSIYDVILDNPTLDGVAPHGMFARNARRGRRIWAADNQTVFDWGSVPVAIHMPG